MAQVIPAQIGGQQVLILREGSSRSRGKEAQSNNIQAAKVVANVVKSALGPKGMDKMLVDSLGDATITSDGATILKEMDVQHPTAKMMVEVAKTTDDEVGDGTTSVVVFTGRLLEKAEALLDKNVHPTIIVEGYRKAAEKALEILGDIAISVKATDRAVLRKVAMTSMASKLVREDRGYLADLAIDAVLKVAEKKGKEYTVDLEDIEVEKKAGGSLVETKLIEGVAIDKEVVHSGMPRRVDNAKIALLDCALEIEKTEFTAEIQIQSPEQMQAFLDEEERMLKAMVDKIASSGANVLICQKGIDDLVQHFLAKEGILAIRRVKSSSMEKLAKATGGYIVSTVDDLSSKELGSAELVEERKIGDDKWVFIEGCKDPKAVTILVRSGTEKIGDEVERSLHDALCVIRDVVEAPTVVAGGGAPEIEVSSRLKKWAEGLSGRVQLAALSFAESFEVIPTTLADNAGLDPIDILVDLRARHEKGELWAGVDVFSGEVQDMAGLDVFEPLVVKEQIVKAASGSACMILRIDDVIASGKSSAPPMPPGGGMPGGMGGY
jgi:thermosome